MKAPPEINSRGLSVQLRHQDRFGLNHPVLFVHGSVDRGQSFAKTSRWLSDYPVITYDRYGYGNSVRGGRDGIEDQFAQQIADVISVLPPEPVVVVGHSFGGLIALAAAARHPDRFLSAAIYEPAGIDPRGLDWERHRNHLEHLRSGTPEEVAERAFRNVLGDDLWEQLPDESQRLCRSEGGGYLADVECYDDTVPRLGAVFEGVGVPVVYGCGTDEDSGFPAATRYVQSMTPASKAICYPGCGHDIHIRQPDLFADLVFAAIATTTRVDGYLSPREIMERWRPGSDDWDWAREIEDVSSRRHLSRVEAVLRVTKTVRLPVHLGASDERVWDGHHRIIAADRVGVPAIPYTLNGS